MFKLKEFFVLCLILSFSANIFAADVILNEYNAVDNANYLNGGNSSADVDGARASDSYFGRTLGNGRDWFELIVITDHLDMRNWKLQIYESGILQKILLLKNHSIWSDLRSGTIITVAEDVPSDISYNPAAGDWWINVQAQNNADGLYIDNSNFPVSNSNWQLRILNSVDAVIFGPAGEGVSPATGVGNTKIFRLETTPTAATLANSPDYDDGKNLSTFGSANQWGIQKLNALRSVIPPVSTLNLLSPNGLEIIMGDTDYDITWSNTGTIDAVIVEFTTDGGATWDEVDPPNVGNTGTYTWLVPILDSELCGVRVANAGNLAVYDDSNAAFYIYECLLAGEVTGDCAIDFNDLAVIAAFWLECENPYSCP
ncbi:MAG: hypothetical protein FVQ80_10550 [Planctomycetes bacterium]|nr:hypothetical protein [Planctomycetota bacterium]